MQSEESVMKNIVIAMKLCNVTKMSEGALYAALFNNGLDTDQATSVVRRAILNGIIKRSGHVVEIGEQHSEKDPAGTWAVCNS